MSELPPSPGDPPPDNQYGAYYRPGAALYGEPGKLQLLADGYFGLNKVFLVNVIVVLGSRFLTMSAQTEAAYYTMILMLAIGLFLLVGICTYPFNKKIGEGLNWAPSGAPIASVLMGLNSALCCGIIGYIVMQGLAAKEMKKYGVKSGFFGLKKKDIEARIAEMKAAPAGQTPWSL